MFFLGIQNAGQAARYYNIKEAQQRAGVCRDTLERYIKAGKLRATKSAGRWYIQEKDLIAAFPHINFRNK